MVVNKTASVNKYDSVNPGSKITYTIVLENKSSSKYENITVTDKLPNNTKFVSSSTKYRDSSDKLKWNITSLASKEKITISYTVVVDKNDTLGSYIESNNTTVNGIKINSIKTYVNYTLTDKIQ